MDQSASGLLSGSAPIAFVGATNASRARAFYEDTLGLRFVADEGVALVFEMAGTMLRIANVPELTPQPFTALGWRVDDIEMIVRRLTERGVRFERYPHLAQDALGVWLSPAGARVAWFKDPDGNTLSLTHFPG